MRRFLLIALLVLVIQCPACGPRGIHTDPLPVRVSALAETYRDFPVHADSIYTSQRVAIRVMGGTYAVSGREIRWYATASREGKKPVVIFECQTDPHVDPTGHQNLLISGECRGRHSDGVERGNNMTFEIRMLQCILILRD